MRPIRAYRSWSAHRQLAVGVLACFGLVALLALVDLVRIQRDVEAGRDAVAGLDLASLDDNDIAEIAATAADRLEAAHDRAESSPWLGLASHLPGVGGQVAGLRELTGLAAELGSVAAGSAERIDTALDGANDGAGRIALTQTVLDELDVIDAAVRGTEAPDRHLVGPLAGARSELVDELDETTGELADARRRVAAIERLLEGPGDYLVLAANNAEMSGGVGMPLSAGVLHVEGGEFDLDEFIQSNDLLPPDGGALALSEDYQRLYANQGIGYDFRGTTGTPNFAAVGDVLVRMSERVATGPVDGVFLVDSIAVAGLVGVTGPIEVGGRELDAGDIYYELLIGNYDRFGTNADRPERVEAQGQYAEAVFDALTERDIDPARLLTTLTTLADSRRVLAWSPDQDLEEVWTAAGADGALTPESVMVAVENFDANKVDPYVQPRVVIDSERRADGWLDVGVTVAVPYPPIPDAVPYVVGSTPESFRNQIGLYVPGVARRLEVLDGDVTAQGRDGPSQVVTSMGFSPRNGERRFDATFELPPGFDEIEIVPSARAFGTVYEINGTRVQDNEPRTVSILPPAGPSTLARILAAAASLLLLVATTFAAVVLVRRGRLRPKPPRWLVEPPPPPPPRLVEPPARQLVDV